MSTTSPAGANPVKTSEQSRTSGFETYDKSNEQTRDSLAKIVKLPENVPVEHFPEAYLTNLKLSETALNKLPDDFLAKIFTVKR